MENLDKLIKELCKLPNETQWLEFKHNNYNPEMIGKISVPWQIAQHFTRKVAPICYGVSMIRHTRLSERNIISKH